MHGPTTNKIQLLPHLKVNLNSSGDDDGRGQQRREPVRSRPKFDLDDDDDDERKRAERNGNRMNASAHKRQVGLTTKSSAQPLWRSTTATATTTTTTTRTRTTTARSYGRHPSRLISATALLILTLMLAGGFGTLAQANHHARRLSPGESRKLRPDDDAAAAGELVVPKMTDANRGSRGAPPRGASQERHSRTTLNDNSNDRKGDYDDTVDMGLDVRESLLDLDRLVGGGGGGATTREDKLSASAHNEADPDDSSKAMMSHVRRLLVRQLTNLIMNHEPETIAARMEGARVRGQMSSETSSGSSRILSRKQQSTGTRNSDHSNSNSNMNSETSSNVQLWTPPMEPSYLVAGGSADTDTPSSLANPDEIADNYLATSSGQDVEMGPGGGGGGQLGDGPAPAGEPGDSSFVPNCPPDYDDGPAGEGSSNLDPEQQQQLLAGADSSGLLAATSVANRNNQDQQHPASRPAPIAGQCVHPGMRMIEVITKIITPILFTIIIIVGLLGNIIVMMVILEDRQTERELTPTNLLILDLSLADLSFIIFCIPFTGWDYSVGHWVFGSLWCKFNQYLIVVCALSSIYTLVLMSIDRFMAIVYPIECISYRTSKNTLYAIYIKWIVILLMASPTIAIHGLIDLPMDPHQYACRFLADQYDPLSFQITFFITSYLFPLILIFCLYLSLLNKLWFGSKPHGHKESLKMQESKKKVTWLVAGIVVVFAICWCPIQVMLILMRLKSHKITATYVAIQVFAHTLGYMNSCVNPIVYAFASETFTNSFKRSVFGRFFRILFCLGPGPRDEHGRPSYNYHSARPSNATFHNTISLNHHNTNNSNSNNNNTNTNGNTISTNIDSNKTFSVHHQDNSIIQHRPVDLSGGDDSHTGSTKTSQMTSSGQSIYDNNIGGRQVVLPLEPRDRGVSPISDNAHVRDEQSALAAAASAHRDSNQRKNRQARAEKVLIPREATISREDIDPRAKLGPPAKQQLVARVVQTGNNQASQRCETACYQQELIGP